MGSDDDEDDEDDVDENTMINLLTYSQIKTKHTIRAQLNINNEPMSRIKVDRVEDYYTMLFALEENLVEYNRLRVKLDEIINIVYRVNSTQNDDLAREILGLKQET